MDMDREDARRWVAEHVMGMARKPCAASGAGAWGNADDTMGLSWFYCRWTRMVSST